MSVSFFLALKFLKSARSESNVSLMIKISFFSIMIGTLGLALIIAITNGFEKETYKKLQGLHSDLIVTAQGAQIDFEKVKKVLNKEFKDSICAISGIANGHAIIQNDKLNNDINNLIVIKGIDPISHMQVSNLNNTIIKNSKENLYDNNIIIGQTLADNLCVKIGDTLKILIPDDNITNNKISFFAQDIKVGAIFKTGIYEFDEQIIFCNLKFFKKIFSTGITEINLKINKNYDHENIKKILRKRLSLKVSSWKDLYPSVISALNLEKLGMLIILGLVTLIACINIIALLFMIINQKTGQIAILKSMGLTNSDVIKIFIYMGSIITLSASLMGVIIAGIFDFLINKYKFIKLPDIYYVEYLPSQINWFTILIVMLVILITSFFAILIPALKTKNINIAQIIKNELN